MSTAPVAIKLPESNLDRLRELTDKLLGEEEQYLNAFMKLTTDFFCVYDTDGKIVKANDAWLALGWSKKDIIFQRYFDIIHPDDIEPTKNMLSKLGGDIDVVRFYNRCKQRDKHDYTTIAWGATIWVNNLIYAIGKPAPCLTCPEGTVRFMNRSL